MIGLKGSINKATVVVAVVVWVDVAACCSLTMMVLGGAARLRQIFDAQLHTLQSLLTLA